MAPEPRALMRRLTLTDSARIALACIRIFNGGSGLITPKRLAHRLDVDEAAGPMSYPFRMFGIRTILIGLDLLSADPAVRRHALRAAAVIHASDTVSAAVTGLSGGLPRRSAVLTTAISATNTALALVASRDL
jgi:hypothetical protein